MELDSVLPNLQWICLCYGNLRSLEGLGKQFWISHSWDENLNAYSELSFGKQEVEIPALFQELVAWCVKLAC